MSILFPFLIFSYFNFCVCTFFFFSSRRRHTRSDRDWSSDVCSSDLSLTLGVAGGLAGCGLAFLCTPAVLRLIPGSIPRAADAGVDLRVLGFALLVSDRKSVV